MNLKKLMLNMSVWLIVALVLSFVIPPIDINYHVGNENFGFDINTSFLVMWLLVLQTTLSLNGFKFDKKTLLNGKAAFDSVILTYVVNTGITLLVAWGFYSVGYEEIAYGFAMLAAMPCAVSVITAAIFAGNNQEKAVAGVAYSYLAGLILTPLISYLFIKTAVDPFEVFKYILMFVVAPVVLAILIKRFNFNGVPKIIAINLLVGVIIFLCINKNQYIVEDSLDIAAVVFVVSFLRMLVLHYVVKYYVIKRNIDKDSRTCFLVLGAWKTTGMAIAMCMLILNESAPLAVVACIVSVMIENLWFSWAISKKDLIFEGPFFHFRGFFDKPVN